MRALAFAIYAACVDFLLKLAALLGITYRDANALLFFVLWPIVTLALALWVVAQAVRLRVYGRRDVTLHPDQPPAGGSSSD